MRKGGGKVLLLLLGAIVVVIVGVIGYVRLQGNFPPVQKLDDSGATQAGIESVVSGNNQFALNLYAQLAKSPGNVFFSPFSISTAMAMVQEGARGQTATEIQNVFHYPSDSNVLHSSFAAVQNDLNTSDAKYKLGIANALWVQKDYPLLPGYTTNVEKFFGGKATNVDFKNDTEQSRKQINDWVGGKTNNKINDLFPAGSLDYDARLVLTNAIYFKGKWISQFNKDNTQKTDFYEGVGKTVSVQMMQQTGEKAEFKYAQDNDLQILAMPYQGDKLSMVVLLPKDNDLENLQKEMKVENLKVWERKLIQQRVDVYLPKFTFNSKYSLAKNLAQLGMTAAFSDSADFSGINGTGGLKIDKVIHQAFVDVNEEGTEAAAATGISVGVTSVMMPTHPIFRADHPFIFLIQDVKNGNILFMGRVMDPEQ